MLNVEYSSVFYQYLKLIIYYIYKSYPILSYPMYKCGDTHDIITICIQNRPVVHKPKALNADGEVIDIWQNMTVTQLASSMQKDLGVSICHLSCSTVNYLICDIKLN